MTQREAFEAWADSLRIGRVISLERADQDGPGDRLTYCELNTRLLWASWQAQAATVKESLIVQAAVEPISKFKLLTITTAYEQGVGKGMKRNDFNPYGKDTDEGRAWILGYEEGLEKSVVEPGAWMISSPHWTNPMVQVNKPTRLMQDESLRALCLAATPGPWESYCPYGGTVYIETVIRPGIIQEVAAIGPTENTMQQPANAAYIAAMDPTTTLRLLDEIGRLKAACDKFSEAEMLMK